MPKIKFLSHPDVVKIIPHPRPATKFVPDWYKQMEVDKKCPRRIGEKTEIVEDVPTMKKCMPIRDYLTTGYIIPCWQDILIRKDSNGKYHNQSRDAESLDREYHMGCSWHNINQIKGSPLEKITDGEKILKLNNPWIIRTPKGYSTYFTAPFFHENDVTILPAIVDTDTHDVAINFPSIIHGDECHIEIGTPLVHAIPFKRDNWDSVVGELDAEAANVANLNFSSRLQSVYTNKYWQRKRFR